MVPMRRRSSAARSLFWGLSLLLACGDASSSEGALGDSPSTGGDADQPGPVIPGTPGGATGGTTTLPPEREVEVPFQAPQAGKTTVYVPNPGTHRVAAVNANSFSIETLPSGLAPTYAATVPGQDLAVVLNVGSGDASILRTENGKTQVERLPIGHDQNAIAIAPDGAHALVWYDARLSAKLAQTFQNVTVLNLVAGKETARGVTVGFRPRHVQFSRDGQRAFVISEDGISVIDLAVTDQQPTIANLISLGDKVGETVSSDVQIVPDGTFAVARREGDPRLRLIDLATGATETLELDSVPVLAALDAGVDGGNGVGTDGDSGVSDAGLDAGASDATADAGEGGARLPSGPLELTDLDLAADGSYALAVVRNAGALLRIPLPGGFRDPASITLLRIEVPLLGSVSVSKQGNTAALYATAIAIEAVVLVDLKPVMTQRAVRLRKAVRAVALSEDGSRALVLHQKTASNPLSANPANANEEARIDGAEGYSLIEVPRGIAKLQLTSTAVREGDVVVTPNASRLFMLLRDDAMKVRSVEIADLGSFQVRSQALAKPPSSLGLVPGASRLFVGQDSEGGMITFLDVDTGDVVHAVSGFELSGRVRQ